MGPASIDLFHTKRSCGERKDESFVVGGGIFEEERRFKECNPKKSEFSACDRKVRERETMATGCGSKQNPRMRRRRSRLQVTGREDSEAEEAPHNVDDAHEGWFLFFGSGGGRGALVVSFKVPVRRALAEEPSRLLWM